MPTLSEAASKQFLSRHGVEFLEESVVDSVDEAIAAASRLGWPVVVKLCGATIAHKTERGLVRLRLNDPDQVRVAGTELLALARPDDGAVQLLVAPMVTGARELIAGVVSDAQFGPCVMVGIGGILTEVFGDAVFRMVPVTETDAREMIDDLSAQALLGPVRGEPAVDRTALSALLVALSRAAEADPSLRSIDINPLIISGGRPIPVDALVEVDRSAPGDGPPVVLVGSSGTESGVAR